MAKQYLRIVSMATGIYIIPFILCAFIKNDNNPNLFMIGMIVCNVTNLALDYILIFIFKLGMIGAAISTVSSQVILILVLCTHFLRKNRKIGLQYLDIRFEDIKRIVIIGMPSFMNEITGGIIVFIFNIYFMKYGGELAVSSYSIIANINFLVYLIYSEVGQSIQPLISYNYGSSKFKRTKNFFIYGLSCNLIFSALVFIVINNWPREVIEIFNKDNANLINFTLSNISKYFSATILVAINILYTT